MPSRRIFFLHNPKAGGSSLRAVCNTLTGDGSVAPVFSNAPNEHRAGSDNIHRYIGFDLYAGHYGYDAYRKLNDRHLLITNFRDPVKRVYSIYRYWKNNISLASMKQAHPDDVAVVELAHNLTFSEFVRADNDDLKLYISNFHFRQLHRSGWEKSHIDGWAEWIVKRRISKMPWFYIAETPQASDRLLKRQFPQTAGLEIPRDNQSAGNFDAMDPEDAEYLTRLNVFDYAIYAYALELQEARLKRANCH